MLTRRTLFCCFALIATPVVAQPKPVLVFAAASLQSTLPALLAEWQRQSGRSGIASYGASSALARQIEAGAPADVFISADQDWMNWLEQRNLTKPGARKVIALGSLVLIAPKDDTAMLSVGPGFPLAREIGTSRLAMGQPNAVPAGKYGKAALEKLGIWNEVEPKVAGTDNVRAALALVARGEARFGIVYATDAKAEPRVRVVATFPTRLHAPIEYPAALTAASTNPDAASFLTFLSGPAARRILAADGFVTPE
ncbi:MAG: molybdate ABC transporter substrate-binding protein [Proteobacteria bacterium]|nr:molybdate ABC transporter substrate-binding protein [Pseudomonadota bacterium]